MTEALERIYFDRYTGKYCLQKDAAAPPERYIDVFSNCLGNFVEHIQVCRVDTSHYEEFRLSISFDEKFYTGDYRTVEAARQFHFRRNKCEPLRVIRYEIPEHLFREYCERLKGIEE